MPGACVMGGEDWISKKAGAHAEKTLKAG
jgi:hypothetical protein